MELYRDLTFNISNTGEVQFTDQQIDDVAIVSKGLVTSGF